MYRRSARNDIRRQPLLDRSGGADVDIAAIDLNRLLKMLLFIGPRPAPVPTPWFNNQRNGAEDRRYGDRYSHSPDASKTFGQIGD